MRTSASEVREAEAMKLDTISTLKAELEGYRKQLAKSYLTDKDYTDHLIQEAYDRSKEEVNVSHILVGCDESANPADTLAAYKKALDFRARLLKGEDFAKLAKESAEKTKATLRPKTMAGHLVGSLFSRQYIRLRVQHTVSKQERSLCLSAHSMDIT
jgi:peptidyl-prolyl cis-trans isomerase SurA